MVTGKVTAQAMMVLPNEWRVSEDIPYQNGARCWPGIGMTATPWRRVLSLVTAGGFHSEVSTQVATETTHILGGFWLT
jgi:hypothetical protein